MEEKSCKMIYKFANKITEPLHEKKKKKKKKKKKNKATIWNSENVVKERKLIKT